MKQILSLIRKEWNENSRFFIFVPVGAFLFASMLMLTYVYLSGIPSVFYATHFFASYASTLIFMGIFCAYSAFRFTEKQSHTINEIMLPSSTFQKWIAKYLIYHIFPLITCFIVFCLLQIISISIIENLNREIKIIPLSRLPDRWEIIAIFLIAYSFIQSFFFVGMLHFKRFAFPITFGVSIILSVAFSLGTYKLSEVFLGRLNSLFLENKIPVYNNYAYYPYDFYYESAPAMIFIKFIAFYVGIPVLLFVASYFKFKERELR